MEPDELTELAEKARGKRERTIGLTMAVTAALLASATLMGHRLHTEETVQQTKLADAWAYYQAKNNRYHMYLADAKLAELFGPSGASLGKEWRRKAEQEQAEADAARRDAEKLDEEARAIARRATFFDASEISLEVAIVLCSVALLTGGLAFWRISFLPAAAGVAVAAIGLLRR